MSSTDIIDLEHLMIGVRSHDLAIAEFTKLGFKHRSARGLAPMGGAEAGGVGGSAVIMMHPRTPGSANYLELSYLDKPFAAPFMFPILDGVEGGAMLVHASSDARALHQRWSSAGLDLLPLIEISLAPTSEGVGEGQDIKIIIPSGDQPIWCNACQYSSIDEFLIPELMDHPNGAISWTGLVVVADEAELQSVCQHFQTIYAQSGRTIDFGHRFDLPGMTVDIMSNRRFADEFDTPGHRNGSSGPSISMVRVEVRSLARLRQVLTENEATFDDRDTYLLAPASGLILQFTESPQNA